MRVYIKTQKGFRLLTRLDSHAINRNEYGGIGALDTSARIMVHAYLRWPRDHLLARRIFLEGTTPLYLDLNLNPELRRPVTAVRKLNLIRLTQAQYGG